MGIFWTWCFRFPALVFGAASIAGGFLQTWGWSVAWTGLLIGWVIAQMAGACARRARERSLRRSEEQSRGKIITGRFGDESRQSQRRAA